MKINRILYILLAAILFTNCVKDDDDEAVEYVKIGDAIPVFSVSGNYKDYDSTEAKGKVTLITLFNPECKDCKRELTSLQYLWENLKSDADFEMVNVARGITLDALSKAENGSAWLSMPCYPDPDKFIYNLFATRTIPRIYLADKNGIVRQMWVENTHMTQVQLLETIKSYIEMP